MRFLDFFRRKKTPVLRHQPVTALISQAGSPRPVLLKTLLIVYNPVVEPATGRSLSQVMNWNRVDDLVRGYISDVQQVSGGLMRHEIVQRIDVDAFPAKVDGFVYDAESFLNVLRGIAPPYMPQEADYHAILRQFEILPRVASGEIDEVWLFNFPHAGFYESIMGGPGAFWCNAPPLLNTEASRRRFVIMGFSYERGAGEMLENLGHRAESILEKTFEHTSDDANLWNRFTRYEQTHPGRAALGNVHFAPNSASDYDWGNPSTVLSECDDWRDNFPGFKGAVRPVTSAEWGNGDIRKHHKWWMSHFPKVAGEANGILYNWWQYIADPNHVKT